ncbi:MAG: serine/threonine protein kinase [Planctomycetes bacterium]|nr:serine/threonine protein kinase [Planctomycetota bacterium]
MQFAEHDLKDRDEIKLGDTVFQVGVFVPAYCAECKVEIPQEKRELAQRAPGIFQCELCRAKAETAGIKEPPRPKPKVCAKCGRDVAREVGEQRQGDYVCVSCKADPLQILKRLLGLADRGAPSLVAIRGYDIIEELGRGGMGAVYKARHERTGQLVALKVMLPKVAADKRATEAFEREIENTKALHHANVVRFHANGCSEGAFFFTVEFCDGGSVDKLMQKRGGNLSIDEAARIILQTLDGLEYAHHAEIPKVKLRDGTYGRGEGLVHRDLSPHNILLAGSGPSRVAKVSDFGLAKAFDTAGLSGLTRTGTAAGKPWFMPRPQVINYKYSKPDVDVWATAACLYNMLTGQIPRDFPGGRDPWETVLRTSAVPIRKRDRSIPKRLAEVIDAALQDDPSIGFQTAAELKCALEGVL